MNCANKIQTLFITLLLILLSNSIHAMDSCKGELMEVSNMRKTIQTTPKLRRDLHFLRQAAGMLHQRGKEEECEETVEAMRELLEEHKENKQQQAQVDYLQSAEKLSSIGNKVVVENITGSPVYNLEGKDLGNIESVVINTHTGTVEYVVLSYGGFIGFGEKNVAIAWDALRITPDRESYVIDISSESLESSPELGDESLPSNLDLDWLKF